MRIMLTIIGILVLVSAYIYVQSLPWRYEIYGHVFTSSAMDANELDANLLERAQAFAVVDDVESYYLGRCFTPNNPSRAEIRRSLRRLEKAGKIRDEGGRWVPSR